MHFLKYVLVAAVSVIPLITSATSVDEIKQNAKKNRESATLGTASTPPNQVAIAPAISWVPQLNLNNAKGAPPIELSNATGQIANTSGVSNDIQEFVKNEIANAKPTTPASGWEIVYSGSGTNSINIVGNYRNWKATVSYQLNNDGSVSSFTNTFTGSSGGLLSIARTVEGRTVSVTSAINSRASLPVRSEGQSYEFSYNCHRGSCNTRTAWFSLQNIKFTKFEVER